MERLLAEHTCLTDGLAENERARKDLRGQLDKVEAQLAAALLSSGKDRLVVNAFAVSLEPASCVTAEQRREKERLATEKRIREGSGLGAEEVARLAALVLKPSPPRRQTATANPRPRVVVTRLAR